MDSDAAVARGVAALYIANIVTLGLNSLFYVLLTNYVSLAEVGLVALLNVVVVGGATLAVLALPVTGSAVAATPPAVTRFLPQFAREGGSARRIYLVSLAICSSVSLLLTFILTMPSVASSIAGPLDASSVSYAALDAIVYSFAQLGGYSLLGSGRTAVAGKLIIVSSVLRYVFAAAFLLYGLGVPGVFAGQAAGDFTMALAANVLAVKAVGSRGPVSNMRPVVSYMVSVLVAAAVGFGVSQTDKLLAFFQQGLGNLGIYNVATVGAAVASFAPSAVTNVLVPSLSAFGNDPAARTTVLRNYTRYVTFVAAPMGFGLAALSPFLLRIFGDAYVAGAPLLSLISISISLTAIGSVYSSGLLVEHRAHFFSVSNVIGLVGLVSVAVVSVPQLGLLGVAAGRATMSFLVLGCLAYFARGAGQLVLDGPAYAKSVAASSVMAVLVYSALSLASGLFSFSRAAAAVSSLAMMPVGLLIFLVLMKAMKGIGPADVEFLERILPRRLARFASLARRFL